MPSPTRGALPPARGRRCFNPTSASPAGRPTRCAAPVASRGRHAYARRCRAATGWPAALLLTAAMRSLAVMGSRRWPIRVEPFSDGSSRIATGSQQARRLPFALGAHRDPIRRAIRARPRHSCSMSSPHRACPRSFARRGLRRGDRRRVGRAMAARHVSRRIPRRLRAERRARRRWFDGPALARRAGAALHGASPRAGTRARASPTAGAGVACLRAPRTARGDSGP